MSERDDDRPDPDALLADAKREERGRLRIFLGAAPGVGKTYAMLKAARREKREGVDVVAGVIETHGRRETERLSVGIETVPRRLIVYRDRPLPEMDLDALLARRPTLALVDELAHTNVPGSRHAKRWQDVRELIEAGIDVYTTLNVQHLESLNDVVERIAGIEVRETLPDAVLQEADEIELVDLSPDDLQKRLREGKVYVPEQAERAVARFFSRGNLTALREMAMRAAAERVDRDMLDYRAAHAVEASWPTRERLLVCLGMGGDPMRLVRVGKRMADRGRAPWIVAHVVEGGPGAGEAEARADKALLLAERLGAETETLPAPRAPAEAVLDFARRRNVSRIVVGAGPRKGLARLVGDGAGFEVTVVGRDPGRRPAPRAEAERGAAGDYLIAVGAVAAAVPVASGLQAVLPQADVSLVFLAAVLGAAMLGRVGAALAASVIAFLAYNFFLTEPRFTFLIERPDQLVTVVFFLVFAAVTGTLAARLKRQIDTVRAASRQTRALYEFSRRALAATSEHDMAHAIVSHVHATLGLDAVRLQRGPGGRPAPVAARPEASGLGEDARAAAAWALGRAERAGWTTDTLPASRWLFLPLATSEAPLGVLGVAPPEGGPRTLGAADLRLLETLSDQSALILERGRMIAQTTAAERYSQTEKLRTALLSSVSHDLRTPLVAIVGSVSSLRALGERLSPADREALLADVAAEAERLNRFIQNLLDMARLGYGALRLRLEWLDLADVVAAAVERLRLRLGATRVAVAIAPEAALVHADPTLLEQCLVNLIDNAARFAPEGTPVEIRAERANGALALSVADHGPGVAPGERERLFDMFHRAGGGDAQGAGTGLGLAIVRGFVEAMGGQVRIDTREGGGALFTLEIPQPERPPHMGADETAAAEPAR
ncbi:MAG: ATP-binding protein [Paracoccaceae bacterium]